MLDDAIAERSIEDSHQQTQQSKDELLYHEENVQLNLKSLSYGENSVMDDSDNVKKESNAEINKAREILL